MQNTEQKHRISIPSYNLCEELISSISHGLGAVLGLVGMILCTIKSVHAQDGFRLAASIVFGLMVMLLYLTSCLYHALKVNRAKRVFRVLDHCTIFLLIAGTYTPYALISLRDSIGWWVFGVIWFTAAVGVVLNAISLKKFSKVSVALYLIMGWIIVFAYQHMVNTLSAPALSLLIWGGVAYTMGAVLYAIGAKKRYFHSVFHFFCLAGTLLHFLSIYLYVL